MNVIRDREPDIAAVLTSYDSTGGFRLLDVRGRGVNNTTRFVEADGAKYVLRIYETHRDEEKVRFEHAVLSALASAELPFRTPVPVRTLQGNTYVRLEDGRLAALFHYMEGEPPTAKEPLTLRSFGEVAARLTHALAKVNPGIDPVYPPYYELELAHPRCNLAQLTAFCAEPPREFAEEQEMLAMIMPHIEALRAKLPQLRQLPHQLIHGDLNLSNALADTTGRITALLDFEFVTHDLRVMEAAVFLSDLIRPDQPVDRTLSQVNMFMEGYLAHASLSSSETEAIPLLLLLRRVDVLIHFLGRYWDGIDDRSLVQGQIRNLFTMAKWLDEHAVRLLDRMR